MKAQVHDGYGVHRFELGGVVDVTGARDGANTRRSTVGASDARAQIWDSVCRSIAPVGETVRETESTESVVGRECTRGGRSNVRDPLV